MIPARNEGGAAPEPRAIAAADEPTYEQSRAIDAGLDGPFLVDAGAGTGKTFTLVQRAVKLVTTGRLLPRELLIVTFTNKAANEIAERIARTFALFGIAEPPPCTTFHAFAGDVVREFGWAGNVPFDARQIDDARARVLFRRVWREFLAGQLEIDSSALPIGQRSAVLERDIVSLALRLRARDVTLSDFESRARFAARQLAAQTWGATWLRGKNGPKTFEPNPARSAESRRAEAAREERNVVAIVALIRRFEEVLEREGVVTFGDVLTRATALVGIDDVRRRLRARIAHALVDEFQDTNPQQLAFLRALFGDGLERVMAVGDIRQAIYGFNGADPEGIARFGKLPGCVRLPLTENRRSYQQILDAAHAALAEQHDPLVPLDRPLVAVKGRTAERAVRAQAFGDAESDVATGRALEARAVAAEIDALLHDGIEPRAIAILTRSRTNARPYIEALRERGIAAKLHGGVGFFDAPEICDARAWLNFLADPTDRAALVRVLQSRTFGFGDGTIARLAREAGREPTAFTRALLGEAPPAWFDEREIEGAALFAAMAGELATVATQRASVVVRAVAERCGIDLAVARTEPQLAEQVRANLEKLVQLAASLERQRPNARLEDVVAELDEREALDIDEPEADVGLDRIAIVTVHGAKGLEWDYVFVVNVAKSTFPATDRPRAETLDWHEPTGALALIYSIEGEQPLRWKMRGDFDVQTGERRPPAATNGEEARLFYVAMTRAKTRISVSGALERGKMSPFLAALFGWGARNGLAAEDLALSGPRDAAQPAFDFGAGAGSAANVRSARRLARRAAAASARELELFETPRLSYTSIADHATCPRYARYRHRLRVPDFRDESARATTAAAAAANEEIEATPFRPLDAAAFGVVVHRALELALGAVMSGTDHSDVRGRLEAYVDEAADEIDLTGAERPAARASVLLAFEALAAYVPLASEARFEWDAGAARLTGAVDAIVRGLDGRALIVDFKTGAKPPEAHRLQLSLYRRAALAGALRTPNLADPAAASANSIGLAILWISPVESRLVPIEPVSDEALDSAIASAAVGGDRATPSAFCANCPYAGALCPEGAAFEERHRSERCEGAR
jgi:DNA helicase-2/ATP-dependent DNA helicase PcrA